MNPEVKTKWVAALRSGEYKQGHYRLRSKLNEFCCLGVLCEVVGLIEAKDGSEYMHYDGWTAYLPTPIASAAEVSRDTQEELAMLNDAQGLSFGEIADWIESRL